MPSRNTVKMYDVDESYHVYNRGVDKQLIFRDDEDYSVFAHLLKRYLDEEPEKDSSGREYEKLHDDVELVAFCLMPNHFHLLFYQVEIDGITRLMRAVATSYTRYFNNKYDRVGGLFQGIFKAKHIGNEVYLDHITRYIHLNPEDYMSWKWSSLGAYIGRTPIEWVNPGRVLDMSPEKYLKFLADYKGYKRDIKNLSNFLADH